MDVREVDKDTSRRLEQYAKTSYKITTIVNALCTIKLLSLAVIVIITESMKVTLVGTTILVRPD